MAWYEITFIVEVPDDQTMQYGYGTPRAYWHEAASWLKAEGSAHLLARLKEHLMNPNNITHIPRPSDRGVPRDPTP
jgi:hypothetical protein